MIIILTKSIQKEKHIFLDYYMQMDVFTQIVDLVSGQN
nr:MAG TPA: hypothetical protein [Bacteriophage sp.]DAW65940.1 MAG TPA: hypothetical protein [Bacteriophage sp.]